MGRAGAAAGAGAGAGAAGVWAPAYAAVRSSRPAVIGTVTALRKGVIPMSSRWLRKALSAPLSGRSLGRSKV